MIDALFLSPHFDDAVYSCGGTLHALAQAGQRVLVLTICGGAPVGGLSPFAGSLHARWQLTAAEAVAVRRREDAEALALLGVAGLYLEIGDCIYRRGPGGGWLYNHEASLFGAVHGEDTAAAEVMTDALATLAGVSADTALFTPLGLGGHVDHKLVRQVADRWAGPVGTRWYYEDFPYSKDVALKLGDGWCAETRALTNAETEARIAAMTAYRSQRSTFWADDEALAMDVRAWIAGHGGERFWRSTG